MDRDWRTRGACRDVDPELFFPVGTSGPAVAQTSRAKAVCARCPVSVECLEWVLATGQATGVWGGLSEDERRARSRRSARGRAVER
jgi:WhiB family transcriptional regulator, redox-sensing transcriptional regulator